MALEIKLLSLLGVCWIFLITAVAEAVDLCTTEGSLRLVGWSYLDAGRIEICHNGVWGTICADSESTPWSEKNAQVACRALGYSGALNSILHDTMPKSKQIDDRNYPIHYSQVRCTGVERSLLDCEIESGSGCEHNRDAAIACRHNERLGHVRLMGDARNGIGAVELFYPGVGWTGICADAGHAQLWLRNTAAAKVVCRQLGYEGGRPYVESLPRSSIARRSVSIYECDTDEDFSLMDCDSSVQSYSCSSDTVGWVECNLADGSYGNARKVGGDREGIVQVEFYGRWGHICDFWWDSVDAEVACVEFNKGDSNDGYDTDPEGNYSKYISDLMPIWLTGVECSYTYTSDFQGNSRKTANENDLIDCDISDIYPIGFTGCNSLYNKDSMAQADCRSPFPPAIIAGIVLGIVIPCVCCAAICGIVACLSRCWSKSSSSNTYTEEPSTLTRLPRRTHVTAITTDSEDAEVEIRARNITVEESPTEPQPELVTNLTMATPPSYTEASSYESVHATDLVPVSLPPSYSQSVVQSALEPVDSPSIPPEVETRGTSTTVEEPPTESQPGPEADLTTAIPQPCTEATTNEPVHDTDRVSLPPSYSESVVQSALEPVDPPHAPCTHRVTSV